VPFGVTLRVADVVLPGVFLHPSRSPSSADASKSPRDFLPRVCGRWRIPHWRCDPPRPCARPWSCCSRSAAPWRSLLHVRLVGPWNDRWRPVSAWSIPELPHWAWHSVGWSRGYFPDAPHYPCARRLASYSHSHAHAADWLPTRHWDDSDLDC